MEPVLVAKRGFCASGCAAWLKVPASRVRASQPATIKSVAVAIYVALNVVDVSVGGSASLLKKDICTYSS